MGGARALLYATTALTAASYGGFWMLTPALAGELFGDAHYGTVWGFLQLAPTAGSELLFTVMSPRATTPRG